MTKFIEEHYGMHVIFGTHPIPRKYLLTHEKLNTWNNEFLERSIEHIISDESTRLRYD